MTTISLPDVVQPRGGRQRLRRVMSVCLFVGCSMVAVVACGSRGSSYGRLRRCDVAQQLPCIVEPAKPYFATLELFSPSGEDLSKRCEVGDDALHFEVRRATDSQWYVDDEPGSTSRLDVVALRPGSGDEPVDLGLRTYVGSGGLAAAQMDESLLVLSEIGFTIDC